MHFKGGKLLTVCRVGQRIIADMRTRTGRAQAWRGAAEERVAHTRTGLEWNGVGVNPRIEMDIGTPASDGC